MDCGDISLIEAWKLLNRFPSLFSINVDFFSHQENEDDQTVADLAVVLFETATLRSGYLLPDTKEYGERIERMLRLSLNIDPEEKVGQKIS